MQIIKALFWPMELPIAPVIIAAGIAAAGAIASSKQASSAASSATSQGRNFQFDMYKMQEHEARQKYRLAAEDAKLAGLHPLFALGTSPNFQPTAYSQPGSSGSAAGDGLARASQAIAGGVRGYERQKVTARAENRAQEIHDMTISKMGVEIARDNLALQAA